MSYRVGVVSLGCAKNLVDTELMLGQLDAAGFIIIPNPREADVLIVNTCGFITPAKEESIAQILDLARYKKEGRCRVLLVTGCLAQRYPGDLMKEMPEIDAILGAGMVSRVVETIQRALAGERVLNVGEPRFEYGADLPRIRTTGKHTAYVKIAEGCSNRCTYCAIPSIRGPYRSRPLESIQQEVEDLAAKGVKEVILVAQDTTFYGLDLYGRRMLAPLLRSLNGIPGIYWIRVLYGHPDGINDELVDVFASCEKICRYLDLPLQHASPPVLARMGRSNDTAGLRALLHRLRRDIPGLILRTTFMVGFPGEKEEDFQQLLDFMREMRFERVGVFKFCAEEGTPAASMDCQVPEYVKEERFHRAMTLQQQISLEYNRSLVGSQLKVLVEGKKGNYYSGRTEADAPGIDGQVYFTAGRISPRPGDFVPVKITLAREYDLMGELP
ncbi:30S ribosomal protein S12 methylthiotransferase RimO [Desulfofundulus thermocisternus]|uniref:30S ribosomal protein S12 methylthiotransferase RimO n=1 Tax=Desulfofundulus thermocisternus TaxID=42471 RepID=UPI001A0527C9|nr:30S ribosomal protein S12 methylthiotransferase RimO [Desulfofundulus thermocisternus]MBE3586282.1 30S ribosomal protein S12 methylthiotransferase RimO [Thermoanaerobacter sp.]MCS5695778.1 30S ribosomal protein S12 methylthiotransferase RimO [Desulfofundulus thermocisternus]